MWIRIEQTEKTTTGEKEKKNLKFKSIYLWFGFAPSLPYLQYFRFIVEHLFDTSPSFRNYVLMFSCSGCRLLPILMSSEQCSRCAGDVFVAQQCIHQLSAGRFVCDARNPTLLATYPHRNLIVRLEWQVAHVFRWRCHRQWTNRCQWRCRRRRR